MIPAAVRGWLEEHEFGVIAEQRPVGGGCINHGTRLLSEKGQRFFLKQNSDAPEDMFVREAEGLEVLRAGPGPRFPEPLLQGPDFLLLEDLAAAPRGEDYGALLGRQLAEMHLRTETRFGFAHDNYIGSTPQPNAWTEDGFIFFAEQRLGFQVRLARDGGLFERGEAAGVEKLAGRLEELIPEQPASLIHGDLWAGNAISDEGGRPALIDPAAHYGWAEAELGMTQLFGGFEASFYAAYEEARPLEPGWRQRLPLYNLYHLLNHLNLFGRGYHAQVLDVLKRYQ